MKLNFQLDMYCAKKFLKKQREINREILDLGLIKVNTFLLRIQYSSIFIIYLFWTGALW